MGDQTVVSLNKSSNNTALAPTTSDQWAVMQIIQTIIQCGLLHIVAILGCCGNALAVIIFSRRSTLGANNAVLISLAVCDFLYLVNISLRNMDCIIAYINLELGYNFYMYMTRYLLIFGRYIINVSLTHVVIIAGERVLAVFLPFHVKRLVTTKRMVFLLAFIHVAGILTIWPPFFDYYILERVFNPMTNTTLLLIVHGPFFLENKDVIEFYGNFIFSVITGPAFLFFVSFSSTAIALRLRSITKKRADMTSAKQSVDVKTSRLLLTICVITVVSLSFSFIFFVYLYVYPDLPQEIVLFFFDIEEFLLSIGSASNFYVYAFMSAEFQKDLQNLFPCCHPPSK